MAQIKLRQAATAMTAKDASSEPGRGRRVRAVCRFPAHAVGVAAVGEPQPLSLPFGRTGHDRSGLRALAV